MSSSKRRISANPAVAAACATDSLRATAVILTNVPICIWALVTTAESWPENTPAQPAKTLHNSVRKHIWMRNN